MEYVKIRVATGADAEALVKIYAPYVENTAVTFEYTVPTPVEFSRRIAEIQEKYPYLVAERNGELVGYAYANTFKGRAAYDWAVEVSIYVRMDQKKSGVGSALYEALEQVLSLQNILNLNAAITNAEHEDEHFTKGSLEFHRRMGYRMVGEFHQCGCKFGRWYNTVWMEKHLGDHAVNPPAVKRFDEIRTLLAERCGID